MAMKYRGSILNLFSLLLKKPMNRKYGRDVTRKALKGAKPIYRDMLTKTEDIGSGNIMAMNIYMAYVFLAIWKAADGKIGLQDFREVTKEFIHRPVVQLFMGGRDVNRPKDMEKLKASIYHAQAWVEMHPEYKDKTWDFNFDESLHKDGFYYYFTRCPIEKFARENGFLEILPVACDLDHLTAESMHAILYREQTLATGGTMCDYWFVPDRIKDPK